MTAATETWLGQGAIARLGEALDAAGNGRIVLVTSAASYAVSGAKDAIDPQLVGRHVEHLNDFTPNPTVEDVDRGLEAVRRASQQGPPAIVGVGGGSAMDMAKLLAAAAAQPRPLREMLAAGDTLVDSAAALILVPTTAGTGSEATHFATVYDGMQKYSVAHPSLRPRWAIVDPDLTTSLPPAITASTGIDALCQGIESLWAVNSTEESRRLACRAIELSMEHLEAAVLRPTPEARLGMCEAANLAGAAIDISKTTACHALSYGLTIRWDVPHGHAVGISLGEMIVFNAAVTEQDVIDPRGVEHVRAMTNEVVQLLGASDASDARDRFAALMARVGLAGDLRTLGAAAPDDRAWMSAQVNLERLGNNPRRMDAADLDGVLARVAG